MSSNPRMQIAKLLTNQPNMDSAPDIRHVVRQSENPGFLPRRMRPCPTTPEDVQSAHSIELALCRKGTFQSHLTIDRGV